MVPHLLEGGKCSCNTLLLGFRGLLMSSQRFPKHRVNAGFQFAEPGHYGDSYLLTHNLDLRRELRLRDWSLSHGWNNRFPIGSSLRVEIDYPRSATKQNCYAF